MESAACDVPCSPTYFLFILFLHFFPRFFLLASVETGAVKDAATPAAPSVASDARRVMPRVARWAKASASWSFYGFLRVCIAGPNRASFTDSARGASERGGPPPEIAPDAVVTGPPPR